MNRHKTRRFSIKQFFMNPVIKNYPYKTSVLLILILTVCFALFVSSSWSNAVINDPGTSIAVPKPEPDPDNPEYTPDPTVPTPRPERTPTPETTPTPEPEYDGINPLTGLPMPDEYERNRPVAVVLSNETAALPMNGVSAADILYEYPVEGGLTRMLAIYQDITSVPKVGSVRSARQYTVQIAASYDAFFFHAGGSQPMAYNEIKNLGVTNFDEVGGTRREVFFRDRARISGRRVDNLHSVVTTGERVSRRFPDYTFRKELNDDYEHRLSFVENGTPAGGSTANKAVVRITSGKSSTFNYNSERNAYNLNQYSRDFVDANNNTKPAFTNVLILKTSVSTIAGDADGRQNIVTTGNGEGFFMCGGKYIEINWSRRSATSQFVYTTKDGAELELGTGRTFICIVSTRMGVDFS